MGQLIKKPKGTQDLLPRDAHKRKTIKTVCEDTAKGFGYREISTPTFEETGLFVRSVGDATDVVQKEMYTVSAKGDAVFTLKPEGTAGAVRAVLENGLLNDPLPIRVYYITQCFRHEKPQAGRLREFHQFGCEMFGTSSPSADVDLLMLAKSTIDNLSIKDYKLNINSIGCPECRARYVEALREYFEPKREELCDTCKTRLEKNPMRIIDCKSPICREIANDAPTILDYLCDECREHFEAVKAELDDLGVEYIVNPKIVRGLDYYTRTVFEFISTEIGAQGTICAGGRYDGLVEELGGQATPALGFAMGLDRVLLLMEKQESEYIELPSCDVYIAPMGEDALRKAAQLALELRKAGFWAEYDLVGRSLKAQLRYADKIGAKFSMVIGDDELKSKKVKLKNMETGEISDLKLRDDFCERFTDILVAHMFGDEFEESGII